MWFTIPTPPCFPTHHLYALIARCRANNTFAFANFKYFVVVVLFPAELLDKRNVQKSTVFLHYGSSYSLNMIS